MTNSHNSQNLQAIPLFPLPNVVFFPNALLPLHIFEERYKSMTADALSTNRKIAMALLSDGWEKCYYGQPPIEPVVCIGTIVSHERLPDGKFNFLLRGESRAQIHRELPPTAAKSGTRLYRAADLTPLPETDILEIDLSNERQKLQILLTEGWLADIPLGNQMRLLLRGAMRTADIADLVAFHLLDDVPLKQSILADGDICRRVNRLLTALSRLQSPMVDQLLHSPAELPDPARN